MSRGDDSNQQVLNLEICKIHSITRGTSKEGFGKPQGYLHINTLESYYYQCQIFQRSGYCFHRLATCRLDMSEAMHANRYGASMGS